MNDDTEQHAWFQLEGEERRQMEEKDRRQREWLKEAREELERKYAR